MMKHIHKFQLFESKANLIDSEKWEDLKDLIQLDILDKWNLTNDLVSESIPGKSGDKLLEPELHIRINERFDNNEPIEIINDCRNLHNRVFKMFNLYINVWWSSQSIHIMLDNYPNQWTIIRDFNLKEVSNDNIVNKESGGICDYDEAIKIINYLNGFTRFVYDSDIRLFSECCRIMSNKASDFYLVFSLPKFTLENYEQKLCFNFMVKRDTKRRLPVFNIDTSRTISPYIRIRRGNISWDEIYNKTFYSTPGFGEIENYLKELLF
jgi:hypothetical protein